MRSLRLIAALLPFVLSSPAFAATVVDPIGDILPSFAGTATPDLDVTSFSVSLNSAGTTFTLGAVLAGEIDAALPGFYVIGVDTGSGVLAPFGNIGQPNVTFNQAIIVRKDGTANVGANTLTALLTGNQFIVSVPVSLLPSTGAATSNYGFNIWPRTALGNNNQISDFAPNNALLNVNGVVPEPATWMMMILGFGLIGGALRIGRKRPIAQVA